MSGGPMSAGRAGLRSAAEGGDSFAESGAPDGGSAVFAGPVDGGEGATLGVARGGTTTRGLGAAGARGTTAAGLPVVTGGVAGVSDFGGSIRAAGATTTAGCATYVFWL